MVTNEPFNDPSKHWMQQGEWPANWITHQEVNTDKPWLVAYRCKFTLDSDRQLRMHATADQRYELYVDGKRIGRGPERGDRDNWYYETYDLDLKAGEHIIVARVWWLMPGWTRYRAPYAQMTVRPGFLLAVENAEPELLNTGYAQWECKLLGGVEWACPEMCWGTGCKTDITASEYDWSFETGAGDGWIDALKIDVGANASIVNEYNPVWKLRPAMLPPMLDEPLHVGKVRHVQVVDSDQLREVAVKRSESIIEEEDNWNALLAGKGSVTVPANAMRRVIIDLDNYYCVYQNIVTSGGDGSYIRMNWAESLFVKNGTSEKGNRDEIEGKYFIGVGGVFRPDGGEKRAYQSIWWECGRYIEVFIKTANQPLIINDFSIDEEHYPYTEDCEFEASDPRLREVYPIMRRVLEMCSHETYMDGPYYEQLMYVGDTRLQALATYALSHDDRLPKKALFLFDASRTVWGITQSRYPSSVTQIIPPFSLWWISMVYDYAMWRDDIKFVTERMPGVRAVLDRYRSWVNSDGLLQGPIGWNFMDWVPEWEGGIPPEGSYGVSGVMNWQFIYTLRLAAELEDMINEPELALRNRKMADSLAAAADKAFWSEEKGLFAETMAKDQFSEHSQCLALLTNAVDPKKCDRVIDGLVNAPDLSRTTIYFTHYLFETYRLIHRMDKFFERMNLWFGLVNNGLRTTIECPEPSRSDCHAWGAHPMYHYFASVLGIRPSAPGFAEVTIEPQLADMPWAKGVLPHPKGSIKVDFHEENGKLSGTVELPDGVSGKLIINSAEITLKPGKQSIN